MIHDELSEEPVMSLDECFSVVPVSVQPPDKVLAPIHDSQDCCVSLCLASLIL